jgi:Predicted ABC-type sugar transport system, permease component
MFGTLVGVLILGVLNNGMNMLNVNPFYSDVVRGTVIIIAVLIDTLRTRSELR